MSKALESFFAACEELEASDVHVMAGRKPFESIGCGNVKVEGVDGPLLRTWQGETEVKAMDLKGVDTDVEKGVGTWDSDAI